MRLLGKILIFLLSSYTLFSQESMPAEPVICYYKDENSFTEILPDKKFLANARTSSTSTIEVSYVDFPETAKAAYEEAMSLWSVYLYSSQTIRIKATWTNLASGVLAVTGSTRIYKNFSGAPYTNVWYPVALAEAIAGKDLNSGDFEIEMKINNSINWYFGTDARAQSGRFDLITVVMHEIAHGLGITSSMKIVNTTQGQYGQSGSNYIYDQFLQNAEQIKLTNTGVYGNPSTDLKDALTGNALYFGLLNSKFAAVLPKIYAPTTYNDGSSISHFDESTYPSGTTNSLMTPSIRSAEVNHNPGELLLRCLQDLGWTILGLDGNIINPLEPGTETVNVLVFPNPVTDVLNVVFPERSYLRNVSIELLDTKGRSLQKTESAAVSSETFTLNLSALPEGVYLLRIVDGNLSAGKKILK